MKTITDSPSIQLDPRQMVVELKFNDAQAIAKFLGQRGIDECLDIFAPLAEAIRTAINRTQQQVITTAGDEAVKKADDERARKLLADLEETAVSHAKKTLAEKLEVVPAPKGKAETPEKRFEALAKQTNLPPKKATDEGKTAT